MELVPLCARPEVILTPHRDVFKSGFYFFMLSHSSTTKLLLEHWELAGQTYVTLTLLYKDVSSSKQASKQAPLLLEQSRDRWIFSSQEPRYLSQLGEGLARPWTSDAEPSSQALLSYKPSFGGRSEFAYDSFHPVFMNASKVVNWTDVHVRREFQEKWQLRPLPRYAEQTHRIKWTESKTWSDNRRRTVHQ